MISVVPLKTTHPLLLPLASLFYLLLSFTSSLALSSLIYLLLSFTSSLALSSLIYLLLSFTRLSRLSSLPSLPRLSSLSRLPCLPRLPRPKAFSCKNNARKALFISIYKISQNFRITPILRLFSFRKNLPFPPTFYPALSSIISPALFLSRLHSSWPVSSLWSHFHPSPTFRARQQNAPQHLSVSG